MMEIHAHIVGILYLHTVCPRVFNKNVKMVDKPRKQIAQEITQNSGNSVYSGRYFAWDHMGRRIGHYCDLSNKMLNFKNTCQTFYFIR